MLTRKRNRPGSSVISDETADSLAPKKCRICLKEGVIPIFGKDDISIQVMEFGSIEIKCMDSLPQHLCYACHSLLDAAILFRKTAKESEEILKNTGNFDSASVLSEDQDYKNVELYDTDNEPFIEREYLEYNSSSASESEINWKCDPESETEFIADIPLSVTASQVTNDQDIEMQFLKVKNEQDGNYDVDNELVMIIVSDKDKKLPPLCCVKCDIKFQTNEELQKHDTENHSEMASEKKCDICHTMVNKNEYKLHVKQHREKYKQRFNKKYGKVDCEFCGKKINKSYYKYHLKMHGTAEEQAARFSKCTICNKTFSAHYFSDHMRRVHDKKIKEKQPLIEMEEETHKIVNLLKCPVCDRMISDTVYKDHLAKHGGSSRRYVCDQCGKVFKHPSAFKTHSLTHGSELKYQCQFCPYRGLHLGLLKIHVRTHTGDYNYRCTECPARFITKSNLSKHLLRHRGVCKYKCETCNKGFYTKRDVDKHNKTVHLALKNNICNICGKGFGHRDNMLSHQLKVHKREKITERIGRMPSYLKRAQIMSSEDNKQ